MRERTWSPIETAPVEEIKALQLARLIHNVYHVYENVPYYRQRMDEAGVKPGDIHTLADLAKLPFTYKQDLRDTYPYGLFAVPMKEVVELHASSGTTGKQIVAGYTQRDLDIWGDCAARAIVAATTHFRDYDILAEVSRELGEPMPGLEISSIAPGERMQERGW